ncbi:PTS lactose transporter subunit IIC [Pullulanibacillus camelliae]|uniref:Permease IIC component n=1 Tax=Pullulanibacillus camelliae TaxID=1707096 RepID=A0A8J2YMF7_9BACL|nr:PTS transporter subunit EIIC [Pullulanibacillus camelliae]GGE54923.1 PTS lactose transporter subunit IIC [Pullulanibacillus camelliae]
MKTFMNWLSTSFAPKMNKITMNPWVSALSSAMQKIIPFILTGSLIFLYNVIRSYIHVLPDLGQIANYTFGMLGLLIAFMMANQVMEKLGRTNYPVMAGLTAISVFIMFIKPVVNNNGIMTVNFERFGPTGIIVGIIAGLFVSVIFNLIGKFNWLSESSLPDFVIGWINSIIPIFISIGLAVLLSFEFNLDIFGLIIKIFSPIQNFGQTLPGFILLIFIMTFFYTLGISTWLWSAIQTPIFMAGIAANIAAAQHGLQPTNIVTNETVFTAALITMGGVGATLGLNFLMLFSESKDLRTISRLTIVPSIFNINEPIMFSTPVVMNPILMLPMWINGITGPVVIWVVMRAHLLNIPDKMIQVGQIPAPFSSVMITQDLHAIIVYFVLLAIYLVTWYPFFKVYEKQKLKEEQEEFEELSNTVEA